MGLMSRLFEYVGGPQKLPTVAGPSPTVLPQPIPAPKPVRVVQEDVRGLQADAEVPLVGQAGLSLIKRSESLSLKAYLDPVGIPTIGYGTIRINGKPVTMGMVITAQQAEEYLMYECNGIAKAVRRLVIVEMTQNQVDALVDFCYNLGTDSLRTSSLLHTINSKLPVVEDLFTRWNKAHRDGKVITLAGLTVRRKAEYALYIS